MLERLSHYLPIFEMWARLFPQADYSDVSECLTRTYLEYIDILVEMIKFLRRSGLGSLPAYCCKTSADSGIGILFRMTFSSKLQNRFKFSESRIQETTKKLYWTVQTAAMRSSMERDLEIKKLLTERAGGQKTDFTLALPIRFLQNMPRNDRYFERELVMDQIATFLDTQHTKMTSIVLHGVIGCGKSSIAREYVYRNLTSYEIVLYFQARDRIKLEKQYVQFARLLGFAEDGEDATVMRMRVIEWLSLTGKIIERVILYRSDPTQT